MSQEKWKIDFEKSISQSMSLRRPFVGERIKGRVIKVGADTVFVDIGLKQDAWVERKEFELAGLRLPQVGEELELFVLSLRAGEIRLGRALKAGFDTHFLKEAYLNKTPLEGKVLALRKGGFQVSLSGRMGFCPLSHMAIGAGEEPETYVGKTFTFLILEMDGKGNDLVVSRKEVLLREQMERQEDFLRGLKVGDVLRGTIKTLVPYGAFVEIGPGVEGLLHLKEISWSATRDPAEVLEKGQVITVVIKELREKDGRTKVSLSMKDLTPDPWSLVEERFPVGGVVKGRVTKMVPYGAFVDIGGIEGLVHISEISYTKRILRPEDLLTLGQEVRVLIKEIDKEHRRVSLSIKEVEGDPWSDVSERYCVGQVLEGHVSKRLKGGFLVCLEPGINGYLSKAKWMELNPADIKSLREGDRITVKIAEIDPIEKRIGLEPNVDEEDGIEEHLRPLGNSRLGTLGDLLKRALEG